MKLQILIPARVTDSLSGAPRPLASGAGVIHPLVRGVRRPSCAGLACGSAAFGGRRGVLGRSLPV
jgi:hypothetical protein